MYEYEDVARRPGNVTGLSDQDITNILDLIYQQSHRQFVWFSWRPLSSDPGDDAFLEAAIAGGCDFVVTFNQRHFRAAGEFGIEVLKPAELLKLIGENK
jgi:predicted nucleic acid-binding protein